ncbi:STAS-like domain-containing protein [Limibacillus halophilus]|uniref:DUF4325 domain-containing protein n=1 Tax=Limibacillus halophilus TaxID=1579333 RepID=A0A839SPN2_9PROT|nr:STAS-like domain-containing protein [Limibacillus halophilus]MBB3064857.1 hypothetical protein [Limibacillus halophilus]
MVIRALDHVPQCYTSKDGTVIFTLIRAAFLRDQSVTLSFDGVDDVPSSFVNAAFLNLLDSFPLDYIQKNLKVVDSTRQINDIIRRRFAVAHSSPVIAA